MATDSEIKEKGFKALMNELGIHDMERFISLIIKDPFDYTKWQRNLFKDKDPEDLSKEAMLLRDKK
ncbi:MAG: hypothetical protein KDD00_02115 [Ignavibacteriae bacterium]|nr:hypothetical protein [Ignavibacteriota bacterium]